MLRSSADSSTPVRPTADDRHLDAWLRRPGNAGVRFNRFVNLMLRPTHADGNQPLAKALRLANGVERDGIFRRAPHAEEMRRAADRDDERVVFEFALREKRLAVVVGDGRERDASGRAIQIDQFTLLKLETMPARLGGVGQLLGKRIKAARRDLMQKRFPDMGRITVDQCDVYLCFVLTLKHGDHPDGLPVPDHPRLHPQR